MVKYRLVIGLRNIKIVFITIGKDTAYAKNLYLLLSGLTIVYTYKSHIYTMIGVKIYGFYMYIVIV